MTLISDSNRRRTCSEQMIKRFIILTTKDTIGVLNNTPFKEKHVSRDRVTAKKLSKELVPRVAITKPISDLYDVLCWC